MKKITKYFKGVGEEARRVRWPHKRVLWNAVGLVLSVTIVAALGLMLADFLTSQILRSFDNAFPHSSSATSAANLIDYVKSIGGAL